MKTTKFKRGDLVIGIMGVDGGYVGTVTGVATDSRGRQIVTYKDSETGKERVTFAFNLSRNVPESGKFPRKNPASKKEDRPWFWVDEDYWVIRIYSKDWRPTGDCRYFTEADLRNMVKTLENDGYVQRENPSIKIEKDAAEARKSLESFYARKNPRKVRVTRTNPVISLEEYQP